MRTILVGFIYHRFARYTPYTVKTRYPHMDAGSARDLETRDIFCPTNRKDRVERFYFKDGFARRLRVEKILGGHTLCVNRLAWNADGSALLSGSDDKSVLMMHLFPPSDQLPLSISTLHASNIFGVQFMPYSNDRILVSGAMDGTVQLHRLDASPDQIQSQSNVAETEDSPEKIHVSPGTTVFDCHTGRVKDVEIDEGSPFLFWSASEDGTIRQYDLRQNFVTQSSASSPNVLISIRNSAFAGDLVGSKGLDINKSFPHQIAVACGDPFVRVYDRRRLTLGTVENSIPETLFELSPPHLSICEARVGSKDETDWDVFSNRGDKIAAMFHSDHAYAFDITSDGTAACTYVRQKGQTRNVNGASSSTRSTSSTVLSDEDIQRRIDTWKKITDKNFMKGHEVITQLIRDFPAVNAFRMKRAWSCLERKLPGDSIFALRDCDQTISIDPSCSEAYLCRCECLEALMQYETAQKLLLDYATRFPEMKRARIVLNLKQKINDQLEKNRRTTSSKRSRESDSQTSEDLDEEMFHDGESQGRDEGSSEMPDAQEGGRDEHLYRYYCREEAGEESECPRGLWWETQSGRRLLNRYIGHRNIQTDIKECLFIGHNDDLVACGSDEGQVFIYNAETGVPVNVLNADEDVANCIQCHPVVACLATSGIESVVRLWTPTGEDVSEEAVDNLVLSSANFMMRVPEERFHDNIRMIRRFMMIMENELIDAFWR